MRRPSPIAAVAAATVLSLCAAALPAQDAPRYLAGIARGAPAPRQLAEARAGFACVNANGPQVEAAGAGYRATWDGDRVSFLPVLDKSAPRSWPLRWRLQSIARGGRVVLDPTQVPPVPVTTAHRHDLVRGTVIERHVARPEGLELQFVLHEPPRGAGDLVVRLDVDTELAPADVEGADALRWRAPGVVSVTMGAVTAIDAWGQRAAGALRRIGDDVELVVPGWFVDAAAFPLLIDPLIGAAGEALTNVDSDFPDCCYDSYSDTYCVVWTQFLGGGQTGVVGSVFRASDLQRQYAFLINQAGNEDSIRTTNIAGTGIDVLVWANVTQAGATISGLAIDPGAAQATAVFAIDGPGPLDAPALSGEATPLDDDCLVVWTDAQFGVLGCTVAVDLNLNVSATPIVQLGGGGNAVEPAISKQGGNGGLHLVTWIDRPPGLPGWLRAQVVDHDMNLLGLGAWIQNVPLDCARPAVDGDGFRFLVAWQEQESGNPSATDVRGRLVTVGATGVTSLGNVLDLAAYPNDIDGAPDVAMLGDKFGVAYQSQYANAPFGDDVYFSVFTGAGAPIGGEIPCELTTTAGYVYEHAPRLIGKRAGNVSTTSDEGLLVFADQSVTTGDANVAVQAVEAMGPGGAVVDLGGACSPPGMVAVGSGAFALGSTEFSFDLFGAPALAVPYVMVGLPGQRQTCGTCSALLPFFAEFRPNVAGTVQTSHPLPGDAALIGYTVDLQYLLLNVNYVGCPAHPGVAVSNVVRATFGW